MKGRMIAIAVAVTLLGGSQGFAAPTEDYRAVPPFLAVNMPEPNVLIVLDTSNSMDEDPNGTAVGSDDSTSRSEIARNALEAMIENFGDQMRFGLMGYRQSNIQTRQIHNAFYHLSHDPVTFDPGDSSYFTPLDQTTNTVSSEVDGHTVYYDQALPF